MLKLNVSLLLKIIFFYRNLYECEIKISYQNSAKKNFPINGKGWEKRSIEQLSKKVISNRFDRKHVVYCGKPSAVLYF